jgi:hypothetical protein
MNYYVLILRLSYGRVTQDLTKTESYFSTMKLNYHYLIAGLTLCLAQGNIKTMSQEINKITNPENGHQYIITEIMSWQEAQKLAEKIGGYLVTINNENENNWLVENCLSDNTDFFWIGLNDEEQEGNFVWVNGEAITYLNWAEGEPNNNPAQGGENWGVLNGKANPFNRPEGTWSDAPQKAKLRGIIEIPPRKIQ